MSDEDCKALFDAIGGPPQGAELVPAAHFCAYTEDGGVNACFGDSGGPLVCEANEDGQKYLFGVVSWGSPTCGTKGFPAVYTDVLTYLPWIAENTGVN
ncbi:unnamed protein product [Notodromas monacha]|uniref:Peptidase S1 domain-containing protein n=1 Tax=Notodromas monacha TaxID=399045 RepID=A0A7R9GL55_9CRUS|nr:unnamed protein product [Notodromas monacha]CAG0924570.1 unnamed protein product [Notodromas monacha]